MGSRGRQPGFTLLEVVLAMSVLALITAICYAAFHLAIRAIERGEVAVTTAQRLRATSDVLRQIRSTMYRLEKNGDGDTYPYFRGTATSLSFDTNLRMQGGGGATRVSYYLLDNPVRLVVSESDLTARAPRRGDQDAAAPQSFTATLLEGFRTLNFTYYDSEGNRHAEWDPDPERADPDQEGMLPLAVEVTIEGLPGLETGRWGEAFPVAVVSLNEAVNQGGADNLDEVFSNEEDDEDSDSDDDTDDDTPTPMTHGHSSNANADE
jgi:prepilin-type N-terminal cleavage/methylation domain-containing protein